MAEALIPSVNRAASAYKKLQAAHAEAAAKIIELDAKVRERDARIAAAQAILDEVFPDNGGSMGGITE